jgi:hypothetical protein
VFSLSYFSFPFIYLQYNVDVHWMIVGSGETTTYTKDVHCHQRVT